MERCASARATSYLVGTPLPARLSVVHGGREVRGVGCGPRKDSKLILRRLERTRHGFHHSSSRVGGEVNVIRCRCPDGSKSLQSFRGAAPFLRRAEDVHREPADRGPWSTDASDGLGPGDGGWHRVSRRPDHCTSVRAADDPARAELGMHRGSSVIAIAC